MGVSSGLARSVLAAACLVAAAGAAVASDIQLERPGEREFVLDRAGLLDPESRELVRKRCNGLLTETAVPIVVVTVQRIEGHGWSGGSIEDFAGDLYDQWGIGQATLEGRPWNHGVLLLVSVLDRKARIELGAGWSHERDTDCARIMVREILPAFRDERYADGILDGVTALADLVRGKRPEASAPSPYGMLCFGSFGLFVLLFVLSAVSFHRSGSEGVGAMLIGGVFGYFNRAIAPGGRLGGAWTNAVVYDDYRNQYWRGGSSGGGGFSGGSFGGGFSGGGGATGSW